MRYRNANVQSVLRVIEGRERFQPNPNIPLPAPESYESESLGPKPERPGEVKIGMLKDPVPVTGFAVNFSPIPLIAPPPLGNDIDGIFGELLRDSDTCYLFSGLLQGINM